MQQPCHVAMFGIGKTGVIWRSFRLEGERHVRLRYWAGLTMRVYPTPAALAGSDLFLHNYTQETILTL